MRMSKSKNARAAARDAKAKGGASDYAGAARALPVLSLVWMASGRPRSPPCARALRPFTRPISSSHRSRRGALAFLRRDLPQEQACLHPAFKKFLGYGLVVHYAAAAMPRVDWAGAGLIGRDAWPTFSSWRRSVLPRESPLRRLGSPGRLRGPRAHRGRGSQGQGASQAAILRATGGRASSMASSSGPTLSLSPRFS